MPADFKRFRQRRRYELERGCLRPRFAFVIAKMRNSLADH